MVYDGNDENALARRATFREEYLKTVEKLSVEKKHLYAAAILDDYGNMIGTLLPGSFSEVQRNWVLKMRDSRVFEK